MYDDTVGYPGYYGNPPPQEPPVEPKQEQVEGAVPGDDLAPEYQYPADSIEEPPVAQPVTAPLAKPVEASPTDQDLETTNESGDHQDEMSEELSGEESAENDDFTPEIDEQKILKQKEPTKNDLN